ncbi:MAG TPA: hypothetical protein VF546_21380 [Pyrinomonadaceae bacterium]
MARNFKLNHWPRLNTRTLLAGPLLCAVLAVSAAAQAGNARRARRPLRTPAPTPARLIGPVTNQELARESGCRYAPRGEQSAAPVPYIFISDTVGTVLMNIKGRDVRLRLVSERTARQRRRNRTSRGDRFIHLYRADGATVRLVETVTDACRYGDSLCEFNFLRAVFTVTAGRRREVVRAEGACGMGEP